MVVVFKSQEFIEAISGKKDSFYNTSHCECWRKSCPVSSLKCVTQASLGIIIAV